MVVTELMKGGTLQKYLWSIRPNCPDLKLSLSLALGISQAMEYLHANGIIHRDLKPSTTLYTLQFSCSCRWCDFGITKELQLIKHLKYESAWRSNSLLGNFYWSVKFSALTAGNLLLTEDKKMIKLADFGLAREEAADEMTAEAGTYRWMAPEVIIHVLMHS